MEIPRFEHGAWLADAWANGPPKRNLGSSGFRSPIAAKLLASPGVSDDVDTMDLHSGAALQDVIARRDGVTPTQVCITAGTSAANLAAVAALVEPGGNVVCERPAYMPLPDVARLFGADVRWADEPTAAAMADAADEQTSLFLLTSPNNPTGRAWSEAELRRLSGIALERGAQVVVDQVYRELTDHFLAGRLPGVVSTAGLNKCWGAPGLRIGWAVGDEAIISRMRDAHRLLSLAPSMHGLRMAGRLLGHEAACRAALEGHLAAAHAIYKPWAAERGFGAAEGLITFPEIGGDTLSAAKQWLADGLLTIPGELFGQTGHIRIGFGAPLDELRAGLDALGAALQAQRF